MPQTDTRHLVDKDLLGLLDRLPPIVLTEELLPSIRAAFGANLGEHDDEDAIAAVETTRRTIPGRTGDPDIGVTLQLPRAGASEGARSFTSMAAATCRATPLRLPGLS